MAKDDYYTLVSKVLVFLYKRLKGKAKSDIIDYISPLTNDFPVEREYLEYVSEQLTNNEYVDKVVVTRAWGGDIVRIDYSKMRITPKGIDYLIENSTIRKIVEFLPEARSIWELFS